MAYSAPYNKKRDEKSSKSDNEFLKFMVEHLHKNKYGKVKLVKASFDEDVNGIDWIAEFEKGHRITIQKKAIEYCGYDTVTITEKEKEKYKKSGADLLFHCYYNKKDPSKIKQYIIMPLKKFLDMEGSFHRNTNHFTGTDFVFLYYHELPHNPNIIIKRFS